MTVTQAKFSDVQHLKVTSDQAGRRIDNYLAGYFTDIPRARIYKMLRKGEVRVNSARVRQDYRIMENDIIRVPPVFARPAVPTEYQPPAELMDKVAKGVVYEDEFLLVINKPPGLAVHSGSKEKFGVIEILRRLHTADTALELVHRLDKQTSGCLLIARNHRVLRKLHTLLREHQVKKSYLALLKGAVRTGQEITKSLRRNKLLSGQRPVQVDSGGKPAVTRFHPLTCYRRQASLVQVEIATGRMHQIRVHAAATGHPVAGDDKYGDRKFNKIMKQFGLQRMFLHAESLTLELPHTGKVKTFKAPLPDDLRQVLDNLRNGKPDR